ncbi:MAG: NAD(P)/FAD-dependent oxidoreductase [Ruminococcaceae bacterium]|nr:NAD(P)/FAD-dependent oxidoreductase [Oscillospiraceae bacterium]
MKTVDLIIVGGGPAGLAAAISAYKCGIRDMIIFERDVRLGGILNQCIHNGFGLHRFGEELTGPEYANRFVEEVVRLGIDYRLNTIVDSISPDKTVRVMSSENGIEEYKAKAIILAMGCRERPRGALNIAGTRPAGIYTAGTAQKFVNLMGYMPGRNVVILGSGDIGLIMARRMTLEGASVKAVCELMSYSGGLTRNIVQCLDDFGIPLKLSTTVVEVHGKDRLTGVTVAPVDPKTLQPFMDKAEYIECDTLLLSCGLIPENELTREAGIEIDPITSGAVVNEKRETSVPGIFSCGNVLHVHDLVDFVSEEAELAGASAAEHILGEGNNSKRLDIKRGFGVRYTVPQSISNDSDSDVYFRVSDIMTGKKIVVRHNDNVILEKKTQRLVPGEMVKIKLKKDILSTLDNSITVGIEEVK